MDISVIIVSYNTKELLNDCLVSLKKAVNFLRVEIFVVDNNSQDGTQDMVKKEFKNVILIANKQNLGFSKANNLAIKKAKGQYLLILNPDTKAMVDTLIKMKNFMDNNPQIAVSTCRVELPNGQLDWDCRRHFPTPWRAFTHFSGLSKLFPNTRLFDSYYMKYLPENKEIEVDSCVGAFMMVRKSAASKVGDFDEDFFFYGEDLDWCWRFKEQGFKIIYTPITKIIHYKGAASGIKSISEHLTKATIESKKRALIESTRAMELFYKKHYTAKYPFFVNYLVILTVKMVGKMRLAKV